MFEDRRIVKNKEVRIQWLDSLRAIAILLVIYGHCVRGWIEFFVFTSPVKMPLFFIISGYLFNPRSGDTKAFFKNLFIKLVIPWIVLGLVHPTNPLSRLYDLLSGKALWFMPCLIVGETIWFYIRKIANNTKQIVAYGITISVLGFVLSHFHILDFAMFNTALIVQLFFLMGYVFRTYEDVLSDYWKWIVFGGFILYLALTILSLFLFPGKFIDIHHNEYIYVPYGVCVIMVGCFVLFVTFMHFNVGTKWLSFLGQNTLVFYIVHGMGINVFARLLPIDLSGIPLPLYAFLRTLFAIMICSVVAILLNRYLPEFVGKKRVSCNEPK